MKTWLTIFMVVALVTAFIVGLAVICAVVLLSVGKRHRRNLEKEDADTIMRYLPGNDCCHCEQRTCRGFATQAAQRGNLTGECPHLSSEAEAQIADYFKKRESSFLAYRDSVNKADTAAGIQRKE